MKRASDIVVASLALILLSPLFLIVIVLLKCTGEHEVFFRQERMGRGGKTIRVWKFVTMRKDSTKYGVVTLPKDPRVLPIGRFLRKAKINELPQLLNVLTGDMSIIGPRPHAPGTFQFYSEAAKQAILSVKPGLSGIGSLVFRDEEGILARSKKDFLEFYRCDIAPVKGDLEIWYQGRQGLSTDLTLILLTAHAVLFADSRLWERVYPDVREIARRPGSPLAEESGLAAGLRFG